ncbi:DNA processing protein [Microbacterium terrae]|uniref:Smf/DprA SLOG domain-containing protein n=1 Tax=Microbacterium terrae TaxID=69369 RepID=A0A0M2GV92_9MICO|nr:DNA-processing protein DprA [Microbacterium terrae]KJL37566.1 hypothetical protein RS81_03323 [Microbacterium terrae]MBP1076397.1 DNA processing protein [Microbacterium terrae]GLJ97223.1 hypothetical protein GCM10017594_04200 [Microbacterium terrae]
MTESDRLARIVLGATCEPGDRTTGAIVRQRGAAATLDLVLNDEQDIIGIDPVELELWRRRLVPRIEDDAGPRLEEASARLGLLILTPESSDWPRDLDQLGDLTPLALWARGNTARLASGSVRSRVAIVGARAATRYGEHIASDLASELTGGGHIVVSGGAYGIDGAAHRAAIAARPGATVAVMAAGVDRPYPAGHHDLFGRIVDDGGLVLSELPPGAVPTRWRFMQRNRVLAGLSGATVVVEAGYRSGSLDIAQRARELDRPVGAVPGPVTSAASAGCHRLLKEGASVIVGADDVVKMLERQGISEMRLTRPPKAVTRTASGVAL